MTDLNCIAAGLIRLLSPVLLLIFWHKRTRARVLPAAIALAACFPVFIFGNFIRSGFARDSLWFYVEQGLLFGVLEEGAKFLVLRYLLTSYDNRRDAVTYGIGHSAFEEFGAGMACLNLIGTGRAASDIFLVNLVSFIEGSAFCIAVTILIFYGIQMNKSKLMLPLAMLLHFISNFIGGALGQPYSAILDTLITAGICYAAYRCYKALETQSEKQW